MFNDVSSNAAKWLYVPVEIGIREYASRLLFSCIAAERGYNVVFGKKNALTRAMRGVRSASFPDGEYYD